MPRWEQKRLWKLVQGENNVIPYSRQIHNETCSKIKSHSIDKTTAMDMLGKRTMQATVAKSVTVPCSPISGQDAVYTGAPPHMHMLCRAWCLWAPPLRRHCMKDWCLANYIVWLHHQTHQKIPSMYGSHFHRLTHLYFQLFYNKLFCTANFLLCGSISDRAYF